MGELMLKYRITSEGANMSRPVVKSSYIAKKMYLCELK